MNVHSPKPRATKYRTIWISDFHLGTRRVQAELLLDFLRVTESDTLYLVGDIVDNWALQKTWQWDQLHNDVIQKLLRKARKGTKVIYIPGNHDENFRDFAGSQFGRMAVRLNDIHISATGKRYLVMHGDEFDGVVKYARWLAYLGDNAYEVAVSANSVLNKVRRLLGRPYWSLSAYLKNRVKRAVEFLSSFEHAMVREAKRREAHGVICGHVHTPEMRTIDGIDYFNDGDWVESCSALVEHFDGSFELLDWRAATPICVSEPETNHAHTSGNGRLAPAG